MNTIITLIAAVALSQLPKDAKTLNLGDGYSRVETASYLIEVPAGWEVSEETPWGQRKAHPKGAEGELGVMTAPPGGQSWDQLYQTSLYFILRESKGKPTPYRLGKTASGLETASFEVLDDQGFAARRFVLMRGKDGRLLALSVKVPTRNADKEWSKHFDRLAATAKFK
ncbi:MAG: hypothetical protein HZC36_03925 [Armatimonadetes bacterium]|nr:hypothetical protein [Armatimonadota bacterium]